MKSCRDLMRYSLSYIKKIYIKCALKFVQLRNNLYLAFQMLLENRMCVYVSIISERNLWRKPEYEFKSFGLPGQKSADHEEPHGHARAELRSAQSARGFGPEGLLGRSRQTPIRLHLQTGHEPQTGLIFLQKIYIFF